MFYLLDSVSHENIAMFSALDAKIAPKSQTVFTWLFNGWFIFEFNLEISFFLKEELYSVTRLMSLKEDEKTRCVQFILISQESRLWSLADLCSKNILLGQWHTSSSIWKKRGLFWLFVCFLFFLSLILQITNSGALSPPVGLYSNVWQNIIFLLCFWSYAP